MFSNLQRFCNGFCNGFPHTNAFFQNGRCDSCCSGPIWASHFWHELRGTTPYSAYPFEGVKRPQSECDACKGLHIKVPGSAAHVPEPRGRVGTALTRLLQVARAGRDARTAAAARAARRYGPRAPPPKAGPGCAHACPRLRACVGNLPMCLVQVQGFFLGPDFHTPAAALEHSSFNHV